jgi:hypothetical protein
MEVAQSNTIIEEFINDLTYDYTYFNNFSDIMPALKIPQNTVSSSITPSKASFPTTSISEAPSPITSVSEASSPTTSSTEALCSTRSTLETFSCSLPILELSKTQKTNKKRKEKKIKTDSKKKANKRRLCKHIMSVEFSLEYQLNAIMKYPRIAELSESKL